MKLLKKLLPIASVASVAAIVAPIVTSCGFKTFNYKWTESNPFDEFKPKNCISEDEELELSDADGTFRYLSDAKKNKQILADDIVYCIGWDLWPLMPIINAGSSITGTAKTKVGNIDPETGTVSWGISYTISDGENEMSASIEVNNLKYILYHYASSEEEHQYWCFAPFIWYFKGSRFDPVAYLRSDHSWSVKLGLQENDRRSRKLSSFNSEHKLVDLSFNWQSPTEALYDLLGYDPESGTDHSPCLLNNCVMEYLYYFQYVNYDY